MGLQTKLDETGKSRTVTPLSSENRGNVPLVSALFILSFNKLLPIMADGGLPNKP
jgi:hypothetical protein